MSNEKKYIQLPPIERNVDARVIQIIWDYARLSEKEQKQVYDDLKKINGEKRQMEEITSQNCEKVEYSKIENFEKTIAFYTFTGSICWNQMLFEKSVRYQAILVKI